MVLNNCSCNKIQLNLEMAMKILNRKLKILDNSDKMHLKVLPVFINIKWSNKILLIR